MTPCSVCNKRHRPGSAAGTAHAAANPPTKPPVLVGRCPVCNGVMYDYGRAYYCPAEDPHPGGFLIRKDGIVHLWDTNGVSSAASEVT